jgi:hypothetical protein
MTTRAKPAVWHASVMRLEGRVRRPCLTLPSNKSVSETAFVYDLMHSAELSDEFNASPIRIGKDVSIPRVNLSETGLIAVHCFWEVGVVARRLLWKCLREPQSTISVFPMNIAPYWTSTFSDVVQLSKENL